MSDLYIESRLQAIKDIASSSCADIKDADNIASFCDEIYSAIPNLDKIVEELEKIRAKKTCNKEKCDTKEICRICVVDDAIEIVKQGGVSDDVCEWKQHEKEIDVYFTECGQAHIFVDGNPEENNHVFCPYCGKKIKVVE